MPTHDRDDLRADLKTNLARLRCDLAAIRMAMIERKYSADQPRVPAGEHGAGRWSRTDAGKLGLRGERPLKGYVKQKASLNIPADVSEKLNTLADDFYTQTGHDLVVTSGTRDAGGQADAMFQKFKDGASGSDYNNRKAFQDIKDAYDDGVARGLSRDETVNNMEAVIQSQIDKGVMVSRHLNNGAADISLDHIHGLNSAKLIKLARTHGFKTHPEGLPRHLHLELPK